MWNEGRRDSDQIFYDCEDCIWNDQYISYKEGEDFEILGVEFICMQDDDEDELMAEE